MPRLSREVIEELLDEMNRVVVDYPSRVERTGKTITELIEGTACFPGGTGLWRGDVYAGALPLHFPERPILFIGHNFDSISAHARAKENKGEVKSVFWNNLKGFLKDAGNLDPAECFFTNALMGLKSDKPDGTMPGCTGYQEQCQTFLLRQIEVVAPKAIVTLGRDAAIQRRKAHRLSNSVAVIKFVEIMHPSARPKDQRPNHREWMAIQGQKIRSLLT
jgi:hypothetical protein